MENPAAILMFLPLAAKCHPCDKPWLLNLLIVTLGDIVSITPAVNVLAVIIVTVLTSHACLSCRVQTILDL